MHPVGDSNGCQSSSNSRQEVACCIKHGGGCVIYIDIASSSIRDGNFHAVFCQGLSDILGLCQGEILCNFHRYSSQKTFGLAGSITENLFQERKGVSNSANSGTDEDDLEIAGVRILEIRCHAKRCSHWKIKRLQRPMKPSADCRSWGKNAYPR